jgi:hypothetical protein
VFEKYDLWVHQIDIRIVHHHHSIIYLYGEKVEKGYYHYD